MTPSERIRVTPLESFLVWIVREGSLEVAVDHWFEGVRRVRERNSWSLDWMRDWCWERRDIRKIFVWGNKRFKFWFLKKN